MPRYDRKCPSCGWIALNLWERMDAQRLCDDCGEPTERAWLTTSAEILGDEIDFVQHNGTRDPIRFRSRLEYKRWLKEKGYRVNDAHMGTQDGDTSKHSTRWAITDPQTLQNAIDLVTRAANAPATTPRDDGPHGISSDEGVIRYLDDQARIARGEYL